MSTSKKRELGRRLNVLRVFEHFQEKLLGNQQQVTVESTHTIYTREQLARFSPDELIEIVLEMQEKGCDTDDELEVSGGESVSVAGDTVRVESSSLLEASSARVSLSVGEALDVMSGGAVTVSSGSAVLESSGLSSTP